MFGDDPIDRRQFVKRAGAVTLGSVALAGCGGDGGDGGDSTPTEEENSGGNGGGNGGGSKKNFGGWMSDANNYESVVDRTGKDEVTIDVGAGNTGLAFDPAAVRVSTGTKVVWEWTGQGGQHNVVGKNADFESDLTSEEGHTFSRTFDSAGTIKYYCDPHQAVGMKGVVVVK